MSKKKKREQSEKVVEVIRVTNKKFAETCYEFQDACKKAKVEPTPRQASKFINKKGSAYKFGR